MGDTSSAHFPLQMPCDFAVAPPQGFTPPLMSYHRWSRSLAVSFSSSFFFWFCPGFRLRRLALSFFPLQIPWASAWLPFDPSLTMLRTRVGREILVCSSSSNQHCLKGARGTPASSPRFSECRHSETLFPCFTGPLSKLLHCCSTVCISSPQVLDKLALSHFASSNERMLAANSATQGCNKAAARLSKMRFLNQSLKIHLQALPCTNWFHLVPNWFLPGSYRLLWVLYSSQIGSYKLTMVT